MQHPGFRDMLGGASSLAIGIGLIIDGAQRVIKDERVLELASKFKDGVIQLAPLTTKIVAKTKNELHKIIEELAKTAEAGLTAGGTAVTGAVVGSALAAGFVTVLGSHGLGAVALSLGLVSAPVWPILAGGAAGLAIGVAVRKGLKHFRTKTAVEGRGSNPLLLDPNSDTSKESEMIWIAGMVCSAPHKADDQKQGALPCPDSLGAITPIKVSVWRMPSCCRRGNQAAMARGVFVALI